MPRCITSTSQSFRSLETPELTSYWFGLVTHLAWTKNINGTWLPIPIDITSMSEEELEVFGVDWEGLHNDTLLQSREENNPSTKGTGM